MKKRVMKLAFAVVAIACVAVVTLCACTPQMKYAEIESYSFWDNEKGSAMPQYNTYHIIDEFLSDGEIRKDNGGVERVYNKDGKVKKVAFFGWDGVRADAMLNIMRDKNQFDNNGYTTSSEFKYSGIQRLKKDGGLYLAYSGGDSKETKQSTSTSASWTTHFTGVWGTKHGIKENNHLKNMDYKSIMLKYAELGLQTSLAFDWGDLFDINFRNELAYVTKDSSIKFTMTDIDRKLAATIGEAKANEGLKEKDEFKALDLELYNAVACDDEDIIKKAPYDDAMRDYLSKRIDGGDDIVAGIFHRPDTNGHGYGFTNDSYQYVNSIRNCDNYVAQLMDQIEERTSEEWLIITAADHGGIDKGHGAQSVDERTIWIATNRSIDAKYFTKNYDGKL